MTALASGPEVQRQLEELDARTRKAWADYAESLRELTGQEYEQVEGESWELLQRELREVDDQREAITGASARRPRGAVDKSS